MGIEQMVQNNNKNVAARIIPQGTITYITKPSTPVYTANYVVGPKGIDKNIPNPTAFAARNIHDTLFGASSFESKPNISLIQKDVNSALQITSRLNGNPGRVNLIAAQNALNTAAAAKTTAAQNAAMATAKAALQAAKQNYTALGYSGKTLKTGNINIVGGEKNTKIVL